MSESHREKLMSWVEDLLAGRLTIGQFEDKFYPYYIDEVPDDALTDAEHEFFSTLQEKLDWTDAAPDPEERSYGWIDHEQYIVFTRREYDGFVRSNSSQ